MTTILSLIIGIIFAFALVRFARTKTLREEKQIYSLGILVAALIYVGFALIGGASARWLMLEGLGVFFYGVAAWLGLQRRSSSLLALGWFAHVGWDVLLHLAGGGADYTPFWYPWLCLSFDLVIALAALSLVKPDEINKQSI